MISATIFRFVLRTFIINKGIEKWFNYPQRHWTLAVLGSARKLSFQSQSCSEFNCFNKCPETLRIHYYNHGKLLQSGTYNPFYSSWSFKNKLGYLRWNGNPLSVLAWRIQDWGAPGCQHGVAQSRHYWSDLVASSKLYLTFI